ncbi:hypothetical protein SASPL_114399 [Salvia splendens]|uniref:Uncharacterized protein n=1 Tax=Salvia splendens TaxID=180675 RepID=A0A8X8Y0K7_SALSN|nr:hypothetical protein SASPL_114399 [Salvia splendens]
MDTETRQTLKGNEKLIFNPRLQTESEGEAAGGEDPAEHNRTFHTSNAYETRICYRTSHSEPGPPGVGPARTPRAAASTQTVAAGYSVLQAMGMMSLWHCFFQEFEEVGFFLVLVEDVE